MNSSNKDNFSKGRCQVLSDGTLSSRAEAALEKVGESIGEFGLGWVDEVRKEGSIKLEREGNVRARVMDGGKVIQVTSWRGKHDAPETASFYVEDAKGGDDEKAVYGSDKYLQSKGFSKEVIEAFKVYGTEANRKGTLQDVIIAAQSGEWGMTKEGKRCFHGYVCKKGEWKKVNSSGERAFKGGSFTPIDFSKEDYKAFLEGKKAPSAIYLCEGLATALSVHLGLQKGLSEGFWVASCHDKGQMKKTLEDVKCKGCKVIVCMDLDKEGKHPQGMPRLSSSLETLGVEERWPFFDAKEIKGAPSGYDFFDALGATPEKSPEVCMDGKAFRKALVEAYGLETLKAVYGERLKGLLGRDLLSEEPEEALEVASEAVEVPKEESLEKLKKDFDAFQDECLLRTKEGNLLDVGDNYSRIFSHRGFLPDIAYNTLSKAFVAEEAPTKALSIQTLATLFMNRVSRSKVTKTLDTYLRAWKDTPQKAFDPLRAWARSLPKWDGKHRLASLFAHLGCRDNEASRAASLYFGVCVIRKALMPSLDPNDDTLLSSGMAIDRLGEKTDIMVVLEDEMGGSGKSDTISKLVPQYVTDASFSCKDDEWARKNCQYSLMVFNELNGINRRDSVEDIKSKIGNRTCDYRPLYCDQTGHFYIRAVYIGSCNSSQKIAPDDALQRRLLFLQTDGNIQTKADKDAWLEANLDQLYAEAIALDADWKAHMKAYEEAEGRMGAPRDNSIWVLADYLEPFCRRSCKRKLLTDDRADGWVAQAGAINTCFFDEIKGELWIKTETLYKSLSIDPDDAHLCGAVKKALLMAGWKEGRKVIDKSKAHCFRRPSKMVQSSDDEDEAFLADSSKRPLWLDFWMDSPREAMETPEEPLQPSNDDYEGQKTLTFMNDLGIGPEDYPEEVPF